MAYDLDFFDKQSLSTLERCTRQQECLYSLLMNAIGIDSFGRKVYSNIAELGQFSVFALTALKWFLIAPTRWLRWNLVFPQLYAMGTQSLPVIMLLGAFIGMVLSVELYTQLALFGQETRLGSVTNMIVVRHIGPVLAAMMLAGRVGGAVSAELGTMRVTEQLDAMRALGTDPIAHLVVPRVVACMFMIPIMTIFSDITGMLGSYFVAVKTYGISHDLYWQNSAAFVRSYDVFTGITKSFVFGTAIGIISCYKGFTCKPGARGVGQATTEAFVVSFVVIVIANFFLATFFNTVQTLIYGDSGSAFG